MFHDVSIDLLSAVFGYHDESFTSKALEWARKNLMIEFIPFNLEIENISHKQVLKEGTYIQIRILFCGKKKKT